MTRISKIKQWLQIKEPQLKKMRSNDFGDILVAQRIYDSAVLRRGDSYALADSPRTFIKILEFEKNLVFLKYEMYRDDSLITGNSYEILANGRMAANEIKLWSESFAYCDSEYTTDLEIDEC